MTKYPQLFNALCAEFSAAEIKHRRQGGRELAYITARTAMNRLDEVLGPENWSDEYIPHEKSVLCKLTITLPDGSKLTKCDSGGYAGMQDEGDDEKSGYSDAFKRACVKFGVGRHLYGDGVPQFQAISDQFPQTISVARQLDQEIALSMEAAKAALTRHGEVAADLPVSLIDMHRHLYMWAMEKDLLPRSTPRPETLKASRALLNETYEQSADSVRNLFLNEVGRFIAERLTDAVKGE